MSFLYEVKSIYELPGGYLFYAYYTDEDNITTGICENHLIKVKDVHQFHYVGERGARGRMDVPTRMSQPRERKDEFHIYLLPAAHLPYLLLYHLRILLLTFHH